MSSPGASARGAVSKFGQGVGVGVAKRKSRKLLQYQYVCAEPPKADMDQHRCDVRFVPKADILRCGRDCYSITSSAPANRRKGRYRADWRNDHSYLTLHQIGRHFPKPAIFTMRPAEFDRDILALSVAGLGKARGVTLATPGAIGRIEYAGYAGIAVSVAGLWWVVLGGYSGLALTNLAASMAGLALLSVSGISSASSLLYCKRLQDCGIGADAVTAARYLLLILFAGTVVFWHGNFGGVDTPRQFTLLSAATTVFIVLPLYAYQLGIGRTTPLTAQVIRALGPVFVFAMEQFDGRLHYSLPTLACILVYSASIIVSNIAHGWADESRYSTIRRNGVQGQVAEQQS